MATQINAVANPIINTPYEAPQHYWHIEEGQAPVKQAGRRPASYFLRVPEGAARGKRDTAQGSMFEEDLKGTVYAHSSMTAAEEQALIDDHFLFKVGAAVVHPKHLRSLCYCLSVSQQIYIHM